MTALHQERAGHDDDPGIYQGADGRDGFYVRGWNEAHDRLIELQCGKVRLVKSRLFAKSLLKFGHRGLGEC